MHPGRATTVTLRRRILFVVATALLVAVAIELLTYAYLRSQRDAFTFYDPAAYLADDEEIAKLREYHDRELGWKRPEGTPLGERPRIVDHGRPFLATFGDSYTYCDDVADDETWQTYLSELVAADVYNFGGNGYGTDQAFLRFREDYRSVRTPRVALGLTTDNIKRIVNVYRKFFYRRTGIPATKPRFVLRDGKLVLLENPIATLDDLVKLQDEAFLARIGKNDLWFNKNDYPRFAFPFVRVLAHRSFWLELEHGKLGNEINDIDPRPWVDLWDDEPSRELMFAIFDAFIAEAREQGARPFLMLLPKSREVRLAYQQRRNPTDVQRIVDHAAAMGYPLFNGVEELVTAAGSPEELLSFHDNHLTPAGNRALAQRLRLWLESHP